MIGETKGRVRRTRMSIRAAMIVVAMAGVLSGAAVGLLRRRDGFQRLAAEYAKKSYDENLEAYLIEADRYATVSALKKRDAHRLTMDYYDALQAKYERAAGRPWMPVGPDPEPPTLSP